MVGVLCEDDAIMAVEEKENLILEEEEMVDLRSCKDLTKSDMLEELHEVEQERKEDLLEFENDVTKSFLSA